MTDNSNKNMGDEYQFPQEEYVAAESGETNYDAFQGEASASEEETVSQAETSSGKPGLTERFPFLQNKRLLSVLGVAVVALIGFKVMSPSHKTMSVQPKKPSVAQRVASMDQQQQSAMMNKLNNLSQDASSSKSVVNQLQNQVGDLKASLNKANQSNEAMRKAMLVLAQQVQNLSNQVKKATTAPNHIKKLPPSPVLTFHLRAVIPGRAWVMGSNGESDSVVVGTKLKNYGTVTAIEAQAGKLLTSSGKTITFNSDGD